jgi:transcriptional regulator with GAF, ATPase, and Fis domain
MLQKTETRRHVHVVEPRAKLSGLHSTFENFLARVSADFAGIAPGQLDEGVARWHEQVATQLGAEYCTAGELHEFDDEPGVLRYRPLGTGTPGTAPEQCLRPDKNAPWLQARLARGEVVVINSIDDVPESAAADRDVMQQLEARSILWAPIVVEQSVVGGIGLATLSHERDWPELIVRRCQLLANLLGNALAHRREAEEISRLRKQLTQDHVFPRREVKLTGSHEEIIGDSAVLREALRKVEQVAPTDSTVLILGETGTGKELMAQAVHDGSLRKDKRMVKVNCASLPASLVEAELFGREKGAYTGSLSREPGRFEVADGSTILLDEVGELPLELQAKLLRVLEDGEFERLGSSKTLKVDVRVLAATNRDLVKAVENKKFREDLYYRLNVFPIDVPPLRDRLDDIPKLVWHFVQEFSESMGKRIESIPRKSMEFLKTYSWPGNVREVRNIVERAMIVTAGPTLEVELPNIAASPTGSSRKLSDVERKHILTVLDSTGWRVRGANGAAETLGLKPTTLEARMARLDIKRSAR